jgi:hypothetical protein
MNENLQSGYHPDADQVGAFVEHALPEHEREQMLSHLAVCPECRAIVALSLPSVEESAKPLNVLEHKAWWSGWTLAWPATAAVFASLAFFVFYQHRASTVPNAPTQAEIASVHPLEPPTSQMQQPAPMAKPPRRDSQQPPAGNIRTASGGADSKREQRFEAGLSNSADRVKTLAIQGRNFNSLSELGQTPPSISADKQHLKMNAAPGAGMGGAGSLGVGSLAGANAADAARDGLQKTVSIPPQATANVPASPKTRSAAMEPYAQNSETITVSDAQQTMQTEAASLSLTLDETQLSQFKRPLPSRLPVLSMARRARLIVAIDTSNTVFLSKDDGKHWKAVHALWPGRAVRAELVGFSKRNRAVAGGLPAEKEARAPNICCGPIADRPLSSPSGSILTGKVTDLTGAVIPGASVAVTDAATHTDRKVRTDNTGTYMVGGLTPGSYQVEAFAPGFQRYVTSVAVPADRTTVANLSLNIGQVSQAVTVQADAVEVSASKKAKSMPPSASQPAGLFEITTENSERWTSADGTAWTRVN